MIDVSRCREGVGLHDPLRLAVAAAPAFPDGSLTASGLRREGARGRLIIERIAGKDYTTLFHIERMRELCRVKAREPGCNSRPLDDKAGRITHRATWIIRDNGRDIGTGCASDEITAAEQRLKDYVASKYTPKRKAQDIELTPVGAVLSIYLDAELAKLRDQFKVMEEDEDCKGAANNGGSRRDLEDLRAAINHHSAEGYRRGIVKITLPAKGKPRDRWLTTSDAVKLIVLEILRDPKNAKESTGASVLPPLITVRLKVESPAGPTRKSTA